MPKNTPIISAKIPVGPPDQTFSPPEDFAPVMEIFVPLNFGQGPAKFHYVNLKEIILSRFVVRIKFPKDETNFSENFVLAGPKFQ